MFEGASKQSPDLKNYTAPGPHPRFLNSWIRHCDLSIHKRSEIRSKFHYISFFSFDLYLNIIRIGQQAFCLFKPSPHYFTENKLWILSFKLLYTFFVCHVVNFEFTRRMWIQIYTPPVNLKFTTWHLCHLSISLNILVVFTIMFKVIDIKKYFFHTYSLFSNYAVIGDTYKCISWWISMVTK